MLQFCGFAEVCEDAEYYVDPHDVESITNGMCRVLTDSDLRKSMIKKAWKYQACSDEKNCKGAHQDSKEILEALLILYLVKNNVRLFSF